MWRNLMSLLIKIISFHNPIDFFAILYPTSLPNLAVEVETRHSHQILLWYLWDPIDQHGMMDDGRCLRRHGINLHRPKKF